VSEGSFFFVTINCLNRGQNHICREGVGQAVLQPAAFYHEHLHWHCRLMLLMPDHLHTIIAFSSVPGIKKVVTNWKKYLAREHKVSWQRDFFDHRLRNDAELEEKANYISL
jgi:putative transposase